MAMVLTVAKASVPEGAVTLQNGAAAAWLAAVVAFLSMVCSILFAGRAEVKARRNLSLREFEIQQAYRARVIEWANEVVAVMSVATIMCELDPARVPDFFSQRNVIRTKLSELIDRGRWFFENDKSSDYGTWKEDAYQGLSPAAISHIKKVEQLISGLNYKEADHNPCQRPLIVSEKRAFVSEIQKFAGPAQAHRELAKFRTPAPG
ncbi:MAG: hypothetical protein OXI49_17760 [Acidobacteriota bacterium]|nr:hypothetical protein [Acidobacteriota bacterium]